MNQSVVRLASVAACLVLFGAGCSRSVVAPGSGVVQRPVLSGSSSCNHPYYPLHPGYKIKYKSSYPNGGYAISVTEGGTDSVKMNMQFDQGTLSNQTISCKDGNLQSLGYVDISSAAQNRRASVETKASRGFLLPKDMRLGADWSSSFDVVIKMDDPVMVDAGVGTVNGTVAFHRKVIGEESITVPAGTFRALKVIAETSIDTHLTNQQPITASIPSIVTTEWWVFGKGMVKSVTKTNGIPDIVLEATEIST